MFIVTQSLVESINKILESTANAKHYDKVFCIKVVQGGTKLNVELLVCPKTKRCFTFELLYCYYCPCLPGI